MRPSLLPFAGLLAAAGVQALTLTLTPAKDNTLFESTSGNLSNGSGSYLFAGQTAEGLERRALLAFDLSTIPANAQLTRAALTLTLSKTISGAQAHPLHRVLADWGEGSSNAGDPGGQGTSAATGDATWIHTFASTSLWSKAGGDYADTQSASQSVSRSGAYTWESAQMLADVQAWIADPATNFGWIMLGNEATTRTAKRFNSRESTTASQRPKLTLEYTLPNSAPTAGSLPDLLLARSGTVSIDPTAAPALFSDPDGDPLTYTALSADTATVGVLLMENILFVVPRSPGTTTLTVSAEDGRGGAVSLSFAVQVNTPPSLTALPDQTIDQGQNSGPLAVQIADAETPADSLVLRVRPDNNALLPTSGIALGGSGANRTLTLTPAANQSGSSALVLTVSDGTDSTSHTFRLQVRAVATPLVGDFDGDLSVGFADFFLFADHFGQTPDAAGWDPLFDLSADLSIGFADFFLFADHFGEKTTP